MTEKQKLLLQLFREVDAICKKHDLRFVCAVKLTRAARGAAAAAGK